MLRTRVWSYLAPKFGQGAHLANLPGNLPSRGKQIRPGHHPVHQPQIQGPLQFQRPVGQHHLSGQGPGHVLKDKEGIHERQVDFAFGQTQLGVVRGHPDVAL